MSGLGPELASKVLAASERNLVKHVGEGGRMSPAERDLMQIETVIAMPEDERQRLRIGALLLKRMRGQRLTEEEKEEIDLTFPTSAATARTISRDSYKELQPGGGGLKHYAKVYEVSDRAIKLWIKEGREKSDLPPLDEPTTMAAWYGRVKQRRIPLRLLHLKSPPAGDVPAATAAAAAQPGAPAGQTPPAASDFTASGDFSYDLAVQFASENLQHAQDQLRKARTIPDNGGNIEACERAVARNLSEYRKAKKVEHDNLKSGGGHVDKRVLLDKFRTRLAAVHQGVRSCPVRVGTKLALPPDVVRQITRAMNEELDALFLQLRSDGWVYKERLTLEAA